MVRRKRGLSDKVASSIGKKAAPKMEFELVGPKRGKSKRLRKKIAKQKSAPAPKGKSLKSKFRGMSAGNRGKSSISGIMPPAAPERNPIKDEINDKWDAKIFNDKQFLTNMLTERMEDIDPKYLDALKEAIYTASDDEVEALLNLYGDPTDWKDFYKFNNENQAGYQSYNERMGRIIAVLDFFDIEL